MESESISEQRVALRMHVATLRSQTDVLAQEVRALYVRLALLHEGREGLGAEARLPGEEGLPAALIDAIRRQEHRLIQRAVGREIARLEGTCSRLRGESLRLLASVTQMHPC